MKRIISVISAATAVLAFYNEAKRAGLIEPLEIKPISLNHLIRVPKRKTKSYRNNGYQMGLTKSLSIESITEPIIFILAFCKRIVGNSSKENLIYGIRTT